MCLSLRRRRGGRAACSSAPGAVTRSLASIEQLLRSQIPTWETIRSITGQPGISIGVIYQGTELFKYNAGALDITTGRTPDSDTLYCIASLSKAFMAASLDLLVQEGKISWGSTIHSVIPEFQHAQQPAEYSGMTVRDICSHRTGLLGLDEITQGLDGRILIDKNDVVKVCRAMPSKHDLRNNFLYNNGLFELAGHLVERVSGYSNWGDFQNAYIFEPLGMERTSALRDVHETDKNIAKPYIVLTDGPFVSPILGSDSPSLLLNGHQGDVLGYTCNIYIIPDSNSAVVVLSNGTGLSDATDWIAQDIIQTISELEPKVDFVAMATQAADAYLSHYAKDFQAPLERHRGVRSPLPALGDFVGTYVMDNLDVAFLEVVLDPEDPANLQMMVNWCLDQALPLRHYNHDVFSYLPDSYDECLKRGLDRTQWSAFLIFFLRDDQGIVKSVCWKLDGVDTFFSRRG